MYTYRDPSIADGVRHRVVGLPPRVLVDSSFILWRHERPYLQQGKDRQTRSHEPPKSLGPHNFQSEAVELAVVLQRAEDRKVFRRTSIQMRIVTYPLSGRADVASGPADEQRPRSIPGAAPSAGRFAGAVYSVSLEGSSVAG